MDDGIESRILELGPRTENTTFALFLFIVCLRLLSLIYNLDIVYNGVEFVCKRSVTKRTTSR